MDLVGFNGAMIPKEEADVLREIEELLGGHIDVTKQSLGYFDKYSVFIQDNAVAQLNVVETRLQTLPPSIGDLKSLKHLDLSFNSIMYLPDSIGNLTNLRELRIPWNKLKKLPATIQNLKELQSLNISENPLLANLKTDTELKKILHTLSQQGVEVEKEFSNEDE